MTSAVWGYALQKKTEMNVGKSEEVDLCAAGGGASSPDFATLHSTEKGGFDLFRDNSLYKSYGSYNNLLLVLSKVFG